MAFINVVVKKRPPTNVAVVLAVALLISLVSVIRMSTLLLEERGAAGRGGTPSDLPDEQELDQPPAPHHFETTTTATTLNNDNNSNLLLVMQKTDRICRRGRLSPVVVERYKLIFFFVPKVACSVWKLLFRRMENGDYSQPKSLAALHDPTRNGLRYLFDYSDNLTQATEMMTHPDWTRAMFVRDPKERLLSAYLDKGVGTNFTFVQKACCRQRRDCISGGQQPPDLEAFLHVIMDTPPCLDPHWLPMSARLESKYWPFINFVGHMETLEADSKRLLQKIGAWDEFGASGWGTHGNESIFHKHTYSDGRKHATGAQKQLRSYYTPALEDIVERYYRIDYENPVLGLQRTRIFQPEEG